MTSTKGMEMSLSDAVAAELHAELLQAKGVTFDVLAERSGVPARTLKRHLGGETPITVAVAEAAAVALGLPVEELLERARLRLGRPAVTLGTDEGVGFPGTPAE